MAFQTVKIADIQSNPFRTDEAYRYNQEKIEALKESFTNTSYWENLLARKTKTGAIQLAYGHHRLEALRQLVDEGKDEYKEIKLNIRPESQLSNERMLMILVQENKDDWRDVPENFCMSLLQVRAHLHNILNSCKDVGEFVARVAKSAPAIKMNAKSFSRAKNNGIGASTIAQFLGETWSRQMIQEGLQLIEAGEQSEELRKLAETLPNVTLANRFAKLMTKEVAGKGKSKTVELFEDDVKNKAAKKVLTNNLNRADVEAAITITKKQDKPDPLAALDEVVKGKKEALKAAAEQAKKPAVKRTPLDRIQVQFDNTRELMEKLGSELSDDDLKIIGQRIDELQDTMVAIAEAPDPAEEIDDSAPGIIIE
jgi:hypothetical protein